MLDLPPILGDSDGVNWTKLIPIGIVVVFWAIGAIASAARKAAGGQASVTPPRPAPPAPPPLPIPGVPRTAPPVYGAIPYTAPVLPPAPPAPLPMALSPMAPLPRVAAAPAPPPVPRRRRKAAPPPLPPPPAAASREEIASEFPAARDAGSAGAGARQAAATAVRAQITPEAVRSAIVLAEVFDPPQAMREDSGKSWI